MGTPIKKTPARTTTTTTQQSQAKKHAQKTQQGQKTQQTQQKKRIYGEDATGRKIDVTSVFDQIEKNTQQDQKDHDKFMQDMFGDVL